MVKVPFPFDTPAPLPYDSTLYHKNYSGRHARRQHFQRLKKNRLYCEHQADRLL